VGTLLLAAESQDGGSAVLLGGTARLGGREDHAGILIRATAGGVTLASTLTGSEGTWAIPASRRSYTLTFERAGYQALSAEVAWSTERQRFEVGGESLRDWDGARLELRRDASLSGSLVVIEELRGAVQSLDWSRFGITLQLTSALGRWSALPNADGTFLLTDLPAGQDFTLLITSPRSFEPTFLSNVTLASAQNALPPVALSPRLQEVQGRVLRSDLLALGITDENDGITIRATRSSDGAPLPPTFTTAEGRFALNLFPLPHTLTFSLPGYIDTQLAIAWDEEAQRFDLPTTVLGVDGSVVINQLPQADRDLDGFTDSADTCPSIPNPDQTNTDARFATPTRPGDGLGDACDTDIDNDGIPNGADNCPWSFNPSQEVLGGSNLGVTCGLGTAERPFALTRDVRSLNLDTYRRPDRSYGTCGGSGSGEVVMSYGVSQARALRLEARADFPTIFYVLGPDGESIHCVASRLLEINNPESADSIFLPPGAYTIVLDGFGARDEGPLEIFASQSGSYFSAEGLSEESYDSTSELGYANHTHNSLRTVDLDRDGLEDLLVSNTETELGNTRCVGTWTNGRPCDELPWPPDGQPIDLYVSRGGAYTWAPPVEVTGDSVWKTIAANLDGEPNLELIALTRTIYIPNAADIPALLGPPQCPEAQRPRLESYLEIFDRQGPDCQEPNFCYNVGLGPSGGPSYAAQPPYRQPNLPCVTSAFEQVLLLDVAAADLNKDGFTDLVVTEARTPLELTLMGFDGFTLDPGQPTGRVLVFIHPGASALGPSGNLNQPLFTIPTRTLTTGFLPESVTVDDLNLDGRPDIIVGVRGSSRVDVFYGEGGLIPFTPGKEPELSLDATYAPRDVLVMDINLDGLPDLIASNEFGGRLEIFLQAWDLAEQRGSFTRTVLETGALNDTVTPADLNQDGLLDLILNQRLAQLEDREPPIPVSTQLIRRTQVLLARGDGTFEEAFAHRNQYFGRSAALDLNQDGTLDVLSPNRQIVANINVVFGQQVPRLELAQTFPSGEGEQPRPTRIVGADMQGDGLTDLLVSNFNLGSVAIFSGDGEGGFALTKTLELDPTLTGLNERPRPLELLAADLNGDDRQDVLVSDFNSTQVRYFLQSPSGDFTQGALESSQGATSSIHLDDANGDGHLDLVAISGIDLNVWLGPLTSRATPEPDIAFALNEQPFSAIFKDADQDGTLDVLTLGANGVLMIWRGSRSPSPNVSGQTYRCAGGYCLRVPAGSSASSGVNSYLAYVLRCPSPVQLLTANIDGEGPDDLVIPCPGSGNLFIGSSMTRLSTRTSTPRTCSRAPGASTWTSFAPRSSASRTPRLGTIPTPAPCASRMCWTTSAPATPCPAPSSPSPPRWTRRR
jgi:hypothetical protein